MLKNTLYKSIEYFYYFTIPTFRDFTPVCTTEMISFARANTYFENMNTCLIGLSVDSNASHLAWVYDIFAEQVYEFLFQLLQIEMAK